MRSPDKDRLRALRALFCKEMRTLLLSPPLWILLLVEAPLVGFSFAQAIYLFGQASTSALQSPDLARGMTPLDGIFVPTFGALYLVLTLLLPFVAIRILSAEMQNNSLKILVQLPHYSCLQIVIGKFAAVFSACVIAALPLASAILIWSAQGGHVFLPEVFLLIGGYLLYGSLIIAVSFLSAAATSSQGSAAILALTVTLGAWVLDFAGGTSGPLHTLASLSPTASLRQYELGLFALPDTIRSIVFIAAGILLTSKVLKPGKAIQKKTPGIVAIVSVAALCIHLSSFARLSYDVSEDRKNSFNPEEEYALKQIRNELVLTIHLSPEDSRLQEMESNVLAKLRRTVPRLKIVYAPVIDGGPFGGHKGDDSYGVIAYEYGGKSDESRSNSPREILPLIYKLAYQSVLPASGASSDYAGFPLVASEFPGQLWFYFLLPGIVLALWWHSTKPPVKRGEIT